MRKMSDGRCVARAKLRRFIGTLPGLVLLWGGIISRMHLDHRGTFPNDPPLSSPKVMVR